MFPAMRARRSRQGRPVQSADRGCPCRAMKASLESNGAFASDGRLGLSLLRVFAGTSRATQALLSAGMDPSRLPLTLQPRPPSTLQIGPSTRGGGRPRQGTGCELAPAWLEVVEFPLGGWADWLSDPAGGHCRVQADWIASRPRQPPRRDPGGSFRPGMTNRDGRCTATAII